jgi:hypothetical protein
VSPIMGSGCECSSTMRDRTCEVDPHGCHVALNQPTPKELQRDISAGFGLGFEHGGHGWKTLDE